MSERTKKIIMITLFLIFVSGIAFLLYFVFFRSVAPTIQDPTGIQTPTTSTLPDTGDFVEPDDVTEPDDTTGLPDIGTTPQQQGSATAQGGVTQTQQLTQDATQDVSLDAQGNGLNYYDNVTGKFYRVDENGIPQELSDRTFFNVDKVTWAPDSNKTILEYPDGSNIYFDFNTQKQVTLPKEWQEFDFNDNSSEIAFKEITNNPDFNWISVANPDGSGKRSVQHLGVNADDTTVTYSPNNQIVAYYYEPSSGERAKVFFVGKNEENYRAMLVDGYGVQSKWTENGDKLLYSSYSSQSDFIPELWIVDAQGDNIGRNRINLGLRTSADKCTVASQNIVYCAVPKNPSYGAGLEPDIDNEIPDDIYKIDLRNGQKIKVAETDIGANIDQLLISKDQDTLFFVDKEDKTLHKMNL